MRATGANDGNVLADRDEAYSIFDALPKIVRDAVHESDYDWHPAYVAQLVADLGAERAVKQLALDEAWQHLAIGKKQNRQVIVKGGRPISTDAFGRPMMEEPITFKRREKP